MICINKRQTLNLKNIPKMAQITSTITLASTTLFPNPANVTKTVTLPITGSAFFETLQIPNSQTTEVFRSPADDDQNTVYFYASSPSVNANPITLQVTASNGDASTVAYLQPNDSVYIPLYVDAVDVVVNAINGSVDDMTLNVFWGSKGGFNL